jgi:GNAT superfamily N-acetyltransferase
MGKAKIQVLNENEIVLIQQFMKNNWRKDHPIACSEDLFLWQYRGYGEASGYDAFQVAKDEHNRIIGFRAVIPLMLQIPQAKQTKYVVCYASAMWMVAKRFRGLGIGVEMHHNTEKISKSSIAIGANPKTSVPIYKRKGYHELKALHRYVIPLSEQHTKLLISNGNNNENYESFQNKGKHAEPIALDPSIAEAVWKTSCNKLFAVSRTAEYWQWRYIDSPVFKYRFFGNERDGIIVVRIEPVINNKDTEEDHLKVLRIIEIIPPDSSFWAGETIPELNKLISGVLAWGKENGCCMADFFNSNPVFSKTLNELGFYKQNQDFSPPEKSHATLLQPIEKKPYVYNLYLRIEEDVAFDFSKSYFVRSDTDQDRPNVLL